MSLRLAPWLRRWCAALTVTSAGMAWGLLVTPELFTGPPIYRAVLVWAPTWAWGLAWCVVGVCAAIAAATGHTRCWRVVAIGGAFLAGAWLSLLLWGHYFDGHAVSWTGVALWWSLCAAQVLAAIDRHQFTTARGSGDGGS